MKVSELLCEMYMKKMTPEQQERLDRELEKFKNLSYKARREEYKPFGKLGSRAKAEHIIRHRIFGTNKHDWGFEAQYPKYTQQRCHECGATRYVSEKGHVIRR